MAAKSYVVTSRKRLDAYLAQGSALNQIELRVGQLTGKPRYPKGWVGRKSREWKAQADTRRVDPAELSRRGLVRAARAQLAGMDPASRRAAEKGLRAAFKSHGLSSKGLRRSGAGQGTRVALVAGVMNAGSVYHAQGVADHLPELQREAEAIGVAIHLGQSPQPIIRGIGQGARDSVRRRLVASGHVDTGRMLLTTQFELIDRVGRRTFQSAQKAERAARRAARRGRR